MKKIIFFNLLFALICIGNNLNAQTNLLIDGSFETGTQGSWIKVTNNNDDVWNDALNVYSGTKNYKWDKGSQTNVRRGQIVNVTAGSVYTITVHYKFYQTSNVAPYTACYFYPSTETFSATSNYGKAEDAVTYPNGTGKICWLPACGTITSTNSAYETFTTNVTAPAGVDKMFFEMYWSQTKVYLDDITIVASTPPSITVSPTSIANFYYNTGSGPSGSKTVSISGENLTGAPGSLTVTGTSNYEVSSDNITFGASASIPYSSASLNATNVYIRLKAGLSSGVYNGENVVVSGGGLTPVNITCNGNVSGIYSGNKYAQTAISWTSGPWFDAASGGNVVTAPTLGDNVYIQGNTIDIESDVTLDGTLDVASGATLTISSGNTLTLAAGAKIINAGTITNNGTLSLMSNANNETAIVLNTGTIDGTGTATVNQYLTTGRNWYIGNPMNAAVSPTMTSGTITLSAYDETSVTNGAGTWSLTTDPLSVGKGYVANVSVDGNITFSGIFNNGNVGIPLSSRTGSVDKAGFNLIANPYPSYLDWSQVVAVPANAALLRSNTLWYRTKKLNQSSQLVYQFQTVNGDGISVPNDGNAIIPPMQSFWVRAVAGVAQPLVVTNAMRTHAPATDKLLKAPTAKNDQRTLVRLRVNNGINTDETVIYFGENAHNGIDIFDAPKMSNANALFPEIYTTIGTECIVINAMKNIPLDAPIGLGFIAGSASTFSITANEIINIPQTVKVILCDNVTMTETDLTDGVSTYQFAPETITADRFSVIFRSAGATSALKNNQENGWLAYSTDHTIKLISKDERLRGATLSVYNAVGQKIASRKITDSAIHLEEGFSPGVYVLKVNSTTAKVIVK